MDETRSWQYWLACLKVFIYASKILESQWERNEMHLRKLGMSDVQLRGKLH